MIFLKGLEGPTSSMLHTKSPRSSSIGSGEEDFKAFYHKQKLIGVEVTWHV